MAVFTAIGAAVAGAIGLAAGTLAFTVVSTVVAMGSSMIVSRMINGGQDRGAAGAAAGPQQGTRIQLPPGTSNKVPMLYGKAFVNPIIIDAYLSSDNQSMTYAMILTETTNVAGTTYRVDNIFWNDQRLEFDGTTTVKRGRKVITDVDTKTDENYKDLITFHVYRWDPATQTVVPVSGRTGDAAAYANATAYASSPIATYWTDIENYDMQGFVFAIMTMKYSSDKGLTGLGTMTFEMSNNITNPAVALIDYMTSDRFGGNVDPTEIDYASFVAWANWCDETAPYTPISGGGAQQAPRYRINGLVNTNNSVKQNIDNILLNAGAWMAYDVQQGRWRVILKKAVASPNWVFSDDNIISGITLSSSSLTDLFNQGEAQYFDSKNKDQQAYVRINLRDPAPKGNPDLLNYNEPDNALTMSLEFCNNNIQAERILNMELEQSRDDLVVQFSTSHYGLQVQAGDVIGVYTGVYGWTGESFPQGKLFRVVRVKEIETEDGGLGAEISALEYNAQVYDDKTIAEFYPRENIGIVDTNSSNQLPPPVITDVTNNGTANIPNVTIRITTPETGGPFAGIEIFAAEGDDYAGLGSDATFRGQIVGTTLTATNLPVTDEGSQLWLNINNESGYSSEVYAVGITAGTKITAFGTGNGGSGTYSVNNAHTLSVRSFYSTVNRAKFTGSILGDTLTVSAVSFGSGNLDGISLITEECILEGYITGTTLVVNNVLRGTVKTNQYLIGRTSSNTIAGIAANTQILNQISGTTGGAGSYTVNISQNVGSNADRIILTADILQPGTTILARLTGTGGVGTYRLNKTYSGSLNNIPLLMKYPYPQDTKYAKIQEIRPVQNQVIGRNEQREVAITGLTANNTNKKYFLRARTFTTNAGAANVYGPFSDLGTVDLEVPNFFWDPDNSKLKEQVLNIKTAILKLDFGKLVLPNNGYWVMKTMTEIDFGGLPTPSPYQLDLGLTNVVENEVTNEVDFETFVWQADPE